MSVSIDGTNGLTFSDATTQNTGGYTGFRNRIINGAMMIDQRNAGASVTASTAFANIYTLDRWYYSVTAASKFSVQRNAGAVTTPAGFTNYLGVTSLSAYSVSSSDALSIRQNIEGFNTADLAWGTASASAVTLSFWARSSLTGTFGGSLANASVNRCYPFSFVISSANTWEYKTITVAGDTSGTWATDNSTGIILNFSMGTGSTGSGTAGSWGSTFFNSTTGATSVVGTSGATFYITGCQLEKGSVATPFEYRQYGTELALCQRYYQKNAICTLAAARTDTAIEFPVQYVVQMRANATASQGSVITIYDAFGNSFSQSSPSVASAVTGSTAPTGQVIALINYSGLTQGRTYWVSNSSFPNAFVAFSAEL